MRKNFFDDFFLSFEEVGEDCLPNLSMKNPAKTTKVGHTILFLIELNE